MEAKNIIGITIVYPVFGAIGGLYGSMLVEWSQILGFLIVLVISGVVIFLAKMLYDEISDGWVIYIASLLLISKWGVMLFLLTRIAEQA